MGDVVSIINGQPIIQNSRITSAGKPEITVTPADIFQVGDSFDNYTGDRVHIMDSRWNGDRLEYLHCVNGVRTWLQATTPRRTA